MATGLQVEANLLCDLSVILDKENDTAASRLRLFIAQHARGKMIAHRSGATLCFTSLARLADAGHEYAFCVPRVSWSSLWRIGGARAVFSTQCNWLAWRSGRSSTRSRELANTYS